MTQTTLMTIREAILSLFEVGKKYSLDDIRQHVQEVRALTQDNSLQAGLNKLTQIGIVIRDEIVEGKRGSLYSISETYIPTPKKRGGWNRKRTANEKTVVSTIEVKTKNEVISSFLQNVYSFLERLENEPYFPVDEFLEIFFDALEVKKQNNTQFVAIKDLLENLEDLSGLDRERKLPQYEEFILLNVEKINEKN